jgi:hypothetical protein
MRRPKIKNAPFNFDSAYYLRPYDTVRMVDGEGNQTTWAVTENVTPHFGIPGIVILRRGSRVMAINTLQPGLSVIDGDMMRHPHNVVSVTGRNMFIAPLVYLWAHLMWGWEFLSARARTGLLKKKEKAVRFLRRVGILHTYKYPSGKFHFKEETDDAAWDRYWNRCCHHFPEHKAVIDQYGKKRGAVFLTGNVYVNAFLLGDGPDPVAIIPPSTEQFHGTVKKGRWTVVPTRGGNPDWTSVRKVRTPSELMAAVTLFKNP